jgi:hypothetical protein
MPLYFDRYSDFRKDGEVKPLPGIVIPKTDTDKRVVYKTGTSRLDKLSFDYYGQPFYGFLILSANPQFKGIEFDIPDGSIIVIPFPLTSAMNRYNEIVDEHFRLYGE